MYHITITNYGRLRSVERDNEKLDAAEVLMLTTISFGNRWTANEEKILKDRGIEFEIWESDVD